VSGGFWDTADDYSHTFNVENELVSVSNNGLAYFYSDHLGSSSALQKPDATMAYTWYLPFGGYRPGSAHTQTITDRDFTGQHENMELGLLYYNARFYAPTLGRFISADTIIPNPADPQSYNRYSYVRNFPLNRIDPTGHKECDLEDDCGGGAAPPPQVPPPPQPGSSWWDADMDGNGQLDTEDSVLAQQVYGDLDKVLLSGLREPADATFGSFGRPRTVNCVGSECNRSLHPGLDSTSTDDNSRGDPIYAAAPGRVVAVGFMPSINNNSAFGQYIVIEHNVFGSLYYSVYAHLEDGNVQVEVGEFVSAGMTIGGMGATANQDTVHLHLEIRRETAIDLSQNLPFVIPGNQDGNFFPDNKSTMGQYFVNLSSLDW
jgi:RHS repeat-associated protein